VVTFTRCHRKGAKNHRLPMNVKCPTCGKETPFQGNPFRPFCSERCRLLDLGNWVSGTYRVPVQTPEEDEDGASKQSEGPTEV
jgi:endogenous inhibitor of DNA gyrase (YacG/DUF329 family)